MKILVMNAGSSSLKYKLFDMQHSTVLLSGIVEEIGRDQYHEAIVQMEDELDRHGISSLKELDAIGHRVVHGGERFVESVVIDSNVVAAIEELIPLAPLHNPANLEGIRATQLIAPDIPQVAVFDTAFHQSIPEHAYRYALPKEQYDEQGIRRYGFHGTSHAYVAREASKKLGKAIEQTNLVTLHLGNGASVCAIESGRSVDISMGFTPLEGLIMGTRSGDIDPAIILYLMREYGYTADKIDDLLNRKGGLMGICGESDMRSIHELIDQGDHDAKLALDMFVYRIRKYIGAYVSVLGRVDAVVFTGGIGENDEIVRDMITDGLPFGIPTMVIRTDEELEIANQTKKRLE